jgi:hypothetical protein
VKILVVALRLYDNKYRKAFALCLSIFKNLYQRARNTTSCGEIIKEIYSLYIGYLRKVVDVETIALIIFGEVPLALIVSAATATNAAQHAV